MADNVIETGRSRIEDILLSASNGEPLSRIEEILLSLYQDLVHLDDQGLIPASLLPPQVFEHCEVVVDDTARFALTTDDVQNGDLVYVNSSQTMYFVLDDTKLDREAGYLPLAAGVAAKAIADELGNDIVQTYATKQELGDKQDTTLASWTPGSATSHSTPAVGDTITEALQKIDNNQRNDEGNIVSIINCDGRYNVLDFASLSPSYSAAITTNKQNDYITVTANGKFCTVSYPVVLKAGEYVYQTKISDYSAEGQTIVMISATSNGSTPIKIINITGNGIVHTDFTLDNDTTVYLLYSPNPTSTANTTNTFKSSENEIVPKSLYDAGFTDYQPYAMTNAELTEAEKQNEADILSEQAKTTGMTEGGSNYITVGGIRVYVSSTAPTGARTGDLWIGG